MVSVLIGSVSRRLVFEIGVGSFDGMKGRLGGFFMGVEGGGLEGVRERFGKRILFRNKDGII